MINAGLIHPNSAGRLGVAAPRHHRRCSSLEPTGESGRPFIRGMSGGLFKFRFWHLAEIARPGD
jgi:hypothetical protein